MRLLPYEKVLNQMLEIMENAVKKYGLPQKAYNELAEYYRETYGFIRK